MENSQYSSNHIITSIEGDVDKINFVYEMYKDSGIPLTKTQEGYELIVAKDIREDIKDYTEHFNISVTGKI